MLSRLLLSIGTRLHKENNMLYQRSKTCSVVMAVLLSGLLSAATKAQTESDFKRRVPEITEAITKTGTDATPEARADAAEHVADLTSGITSTWVDDKAFAELVSFLDIPEDPDKVDDQSIVELISLLDPSTYMPVRQSVIGALGSLGTRAKSAIPALQKILAVENCVTEPSMAISVEDDARMALRRIGIPHPPSRCGRQT
jgi:hypothetical protein